MKVVNATPWDFVRATTGAAGFDLRAHITGKIRLTSSYVKIPTGIRIAIPDYYCGEVRPRSSITLRNIDVALGTIDSDYRGEISVLARCLEGDQLIGPGDRIAQLVLVPLFRPRIDLVESLDVTDRNEGGFGSTGVK